MVVFQLAQPLPSLPSGFTISTVVTQPFDQRTNFFLAITDRAFQPLAPLLLPGLRLLFLLFPALQQLLMKELCASQQSRRIFSGGLLTLALFLQATNHGVHFTLSCRGQ